MIYNSKEFYLDFKKEYPNIKISYSQYNAIVTKFNYSIGDKILYNLYSFYLGFKLGYLRLYKVARNFNKLVVKFGESNKIKQKLIAEGKEPAKKIGEDAKGNPIYNNENLWMVFYTDDFYPLFTFKKCIKRQNKNDKYAMFLVKNIKYWEFTILRTFSERLYSGIDRKKIKVENLKTLPPTKFHENNVQ